MFLKLKENTQPWKNPRLALKQHHSSNALESSTASVLEVTGQPAFQSETEPRLNHHREAKRNHKCVRTQKSRNMPRSLHWEKQEFVARYTVSYARVERQPRATDESIK